MGNKQKRHPLLESKVNDNGFPDSIDVIIRGEVNPTDSSTISALPGCQASCTYGTAPPAPCNAGFRCNLR